MDDGAGRAHGKRHLAHAVGQHEDQRPAGQDQWSAVERDDEADRQHRAGDRERQRGDDVEQGGDARAIAAHHVADRHADQGGAGRGQGGEDQRIDQRSQRALEKAAEIAQAEMRMQHGTAKFHEGEHDDGEERHQRQHDDGPAIDRGGDLQGAADRQDRRGAAAVGGEAAGRQEAALHQQDQHRHCDQQHAQHAGRGRVGGGLADEQLEGFDGEDRHVLGQHEGHAEILQRLDEDQQGARQHRRHHDRQGHRPDGTARRGAQPLGCFFHRDVDCLEGSDGRQQDVGIERQRIDQDDAAGAVDRAEADTPGLQRLGDDAGAAEQQHDGVGADERRQHQRRRRQRQEGRLAGHRQARQGEGEGYGEEGGEGGGRDADRQRVQDGRAVEGPAQHLGVVGQGERLALGVEHAGAEDVGQRVEQEDAQEQQRQGGDGQRQALVVRDTQGHADPVTPAPSAAPGRRQG